MTHIALPIAPQNMDDSLSRYALDMLQMKSNNSAIDRILRDIEMLATTSEIPIIGWLEGAILSQILSAKEPAVQRVLEIGTAIGYSTLWIAKALPDTARIYTIEIDRKRATMAQEFFRAAGIDHMIEVIVGDVFDVISTLPGEFDAIFQDVIKHAYFSTDANLAVHLLENSVALLRTRGLLISDNAFCLGQVLHAPSELTPKQVVGIQMYNEILAKHQALQSVIIPVRDGLWLSQKR